MFLESTSNCGVHELAGLIERPRKIVGYVADNRVSKEGEALSAHIMFSDTSNSRFGRNLASYIRRHKLGRVVKSACTMNPNSGNRVSVWVWSINNRNFLRWAKKNVLSK